MEKEIKYKDDTRIIYQCGCAESRLEAPEYWETKCEKHKFSTDMKNKEDIKCSTCGHARRRHTALSGCLGNSTTTKNIYCDCFGFEFKEKQTNSTLSSGEGK